MEQYDAMKAGRNLWTGESEGQERRSVENVLK